MTTPARDASIPLICDAHCHFFSPRFLTTLARARADLPQDDPAAIAAILGWSAPGTVDELADAWVEELDQHGVARCVLIASVVGDERSVSAAVLRHPDRFVGFFMLDPRQDEADARAREALTTLALRGICLFPAMHRYRLDDERVMRVAAAAAAVSGAVLFVHCGVLSIGARRKLGISDAFDVRMGNPLAVHVLASTFPDLPVIIPHFGAGFFREALMAAHLSPSILFDTSSTNSWIKFQDGLTLADVFAKTLEIAGPTRLLFGTDSSFFPRGWHRAILDAQRAAFDKVRLDDDAQSLILHGNFSRLFPIKYDRPKKP